MYIFGWWKRWGMTNKSYARPATDREVWFSFLKIGTILDGHVAQRETLSYFIFIGFSSLSTLSQNTSQHKTKKLSFASSLLNIIPLIILKHQYSSSSFSPPPSTKLQPNNTPYFFQTYSSLKLDEYVPERVARSNT